MPLRNACHDRYGSRTLRTSARVRVGYCATAEFACDQASWIERGYIRDMFSGRCCHENGQEGTTTLVTNETRRRSEKIWELARSLLTEEAGQDLIEYALVAALIALASILSVRSLSNGISSAYNTVASKLTSAL